MSREWYVFGDECFVKMTRKFKTLFTRCRLMLRFDELNVMKARKTSVSLYEELDKICREYFLQIAKRAYKEARAEIRETKKGSSEDELDEAWISDYLAGYNPVTKYVYKHEVERKRARFMESILADHEAGSRKAVENDFVTAENLWKRQTEFNLITVEDAAVVKAYKDSGVKRVRWVTQHDERVCKECKARDNVIYDIGSVPTKHPRCRCILVPVIQ